MRLFHFACPVTILAAVAQIFAEDCNVTQQPMRVNVRHLEGTGVGFNQGYTTVEGFFSVPYDLGSWAPFLDLRGHVFNNGQLSANAGIGVRYLTGTRVWGINSYYDYRHTSRYHYNQVAVGLESLGQVWDFRINGYLPVGRTHSSWFDPRFSHFSGNSLIVSPKREFALSAVNGEVGAHIDLNRNFPVYIAGGPYYLAGNTKHAFGGALRASVQIYEYCKLSGGTSYDHIFKWTGEGEIAITIPFGSRKPVVQGRAVQPVDRNEIIPVDHRRKEMVAIDPATSNPWVFRFVNNESHSLGTYESPWPTLQDAQSGSNPNDVIYVFIGNGSAYTLDTDNGFVMQEGQRLFGSSLPYLIPTSWGVIEVPSMSESPPIVTNSATGSTAITVANNCEVAGIFITGLNNSVNTGISAADVHAKIWNNWIVSLTSANPICYGIYAPVGSGIDNGGDGSSGGNYVYSIYSNTISDLTGGDGVDGIAYGIYAGVGVGGTGIDSNTGGNGGDRNNASYSLYSNTISNLAGGSDDGISCGIYAGVGSGGAGIQAGNGASTGGSGGDSNSGSYSLYSNNISNLTGGLGLDGICYGIYTEVGSGGEGLDAGNGTCLGGAGGNNNSAARSIYSNTISNLIGGTTHGGISYGIAAGVASGGMGVDGGNSTANTGGLGGQTNSADHLIFSNTISHLTGGLANDGISCGIHAGIGTGGAGMDSATGGASGNTNSAFYAIYSNRISDLAGGMNGDGISYGIYTAVGSGGENMGSSGTGIGGNSNSGVYSVSSNTISAVTGAVGASNNGLSYAIYAGAGNGGVGIFGPGGNGGNSNTATSSITSNTTSAITGGINSGFEYGIYAATGLPGQAVDSGTGGTGGMSNDFSLSLITNTAPPEIALVDATGNSFILEQCQGNTPSPTITGDVTGSCTP